MSDINGYGSQCSYNCKNGKVFNPATRKLELCPECKNKRIEEIKTNVTQVGNETVALCDKYQLKRSMIGLEFSMDTILPASVRQAITTDTLRNVEGVLRNLTDMAVRGERPDYSMLIYLGTRANYDAFVYQYMMKAYKSGLSIVPYITSLELRKLRAKSESMLYLTEESNTFTYEDYLHSDICVIYVASDSNMQDWLAVHGLMQTRARYDLATIVLTSYLHKSAKYMIDEDNLRGKNLATLTTCWGIRDKEQSENSDIIEVDDNSDKEGSMTADSFNALITGK